MNNIAIKGYMRDIEFSHDVGDMEYNKAKIICPGVNGKDDDLLIIRFKKYCNKYKEGDFVEFKGNLRSYSTKYDDKSNVQIYIFTYFDLPETPCGEVDIDGRICKLGELSKTYSGKKYIHFIIANNIFTSSNKINSYIPCTAYGELAEDISKLNVSDFVVLNGEFHSHTYKRKIDKEIMLAHEIVVKSCEVKK